MSIARWSDRLPWWLQVVLLPPLTPLMLVAAACCCPRTTFFALFTLIAIYVPLCGSGIISITWQGSLKILVHGYGGMVGVGLLSVLQARLEQALNRSTNPKAPRKRLGEALGLWDDVLDGSALAGDDRPHA